MLINKHWTEIIVTTVILTVVGTILYFGSTNGATFESALVPHHIYCPQCHRKITFRQDMIKQCPKCGYQYHVYKSDFINE